MLTSFRKGSVYFFSSDNDLQIILETRPHCLGKTQGSMTSGKECGKGNET